MTRLSELEDNAMVTIKWRYTSGKDKTEKKSVVPNWGLSQMFESPHVEVLEIIHEDNGN